MTAIPKSNFLLLGLNFIIIIIIIIIIVLNIGIYSTTVDIVVLIKSGF